MCLLRNSHAQLPRSCLCPLLIHLAGGSLYSFIGKAVNLQPTLHADWGDDDSTRELTVHAAVPLYAL